MTTTKMVSETVSQNTQDFFTYHMCGAIYCLSDMIIFEVLSNTYDQYYLRTILQQDDLNVTEYTFSWDNIPVDIKDIYNYVNETSTLEHIDNKVVLYGTHIGRHQNNKYKLMEMGINMFKEMKSDVSDKNNKMDKETTKMFYEIAENMRIVKKLID